MKKNILLFLMPLLFLSAADAHAGQSCDQDGCVYGTNFYAKILSGVNFLQNTTLSGNEATYQTGYIVAGTLGYCWCNYGLCLEGEFAFRNNDIDEIQFVTQGSSSQGYLQTSSGMLNLLWNVPLCLPDSCWKIQPFIGSGIGYDLERMRSSNSRIIFAQEWSNFAWQVIGGVAFPIYCNTELTLEYRYHRGGCDFYNNTLGIGLVYAFCAR